MSDKMYIFCENPKWPWSIFSSSSNTTVPCNEINLENYSWNKYEQSITMNHKYTSCSLDVNKWSPSRLQMILVP